MNFGGSTELRKVPGQGASMSGRVIIIGAGIAGLCAAVYARKCGYATVLLEAHSSAGGLATSWRRGDYTFETCLHWLLGSNPDRPMHSMWREIFDIERLRFVYAEELVRLESEHHGRLSIYSNVSRLETELLAKCPEDKAEIARFIAAIRRLSEYRMPVFTEKGGIRARDALLSMPYLPSLWRWSRITCEEYGRRFTHPLLRSFFCDGSAPQLSAIALVFCLAWMSERDAGYAIGGSRAIIHLIEERLRGLGAELRLNSPVARILVENDRAVGVQLADGEILRADWVLSAADGHRTIFDLLGGRYADEVTHKLYREALLFPSYVQVSLGVGHDLHDRPGFLTKVLDAPFQVDPATALRQISFRIFHFDPTFAPPGKTAVTCFLPTYNDRYWTELQQRDPTQYQSEKQRVASAVINALERYIPGVRSTVELTDIATPATVIRYTGNWHGSMEGWLMTPGKSFRPLRNTLPGLDRFVMAGQWIMPGGGLPSGLLSGRLAVQKMCMRDHIAFQA